MRVMDEATPELTPREHDLIERAEELGRGIVADNAVAIDRGEFSVRQNLAALVAAGLAGIAVPRAYGGAGVSSVAELRVLEALAYGDGTTPFVIAQHYGTSRMLTQSDNEALCAAVLPQMASGALLSGFGISQVRRVDRPPVAALPQGDGYRFDGFIPWMTGYGLFSHAIIAAIRPDGQAVLAWAPFAATEQLRFSPPMELVAMNGALTVSATVAGLSVEPSEVVSIEPPARRARANATTVPCLFGVARACIDALTVLAEQRHAPATAQAAARLGERLAALRPAFYRLVRELTESGSETLLAEARAAATRLALDCATTLIVATGGGANASTHAAQRRLRETSVFATWGLSTEAVNVAVTALSASR